MGRLAKSYTQWGVFKKCGAQYHFRYVMRLPQPDAGFAANRGTFIHETVESFINGEIDEFPTEHPEYELHRS